MKDWFRKMTFNRNNAPVYLTAALAAGMVLGSMLFGRREQPVMLLQQPALSKRRRCGG